MKHTDRNANGVGGAHNAHDANYLTFHRFENFRELTPADSVVLRETFRYNDHARPPLAVFRRPVRTGERVAIPGGNRTGRRLGPPEE